MPDTVRVKSPNSSLCKRAIDVVVSLAALVFLLPILIVVALAIWIDSGRPVFFAQQRVGRGFRPFTLWKFRSMRNGEGPLVTSSCDRRVTRVGRLLRRAKLDELPQFWNVLRGDMSLVGPRPEVPVYVEQFHHSYEQLLLVRPGITDPAAIEFRNEEALLEASLDPESMYVSSVLPAKLRISTEYLMQCSLRLDLVILIRTLGAVFGLVKPGISKQGEAPSKA